MKKEPETTILALLQEFKELIVDLANRSEKHQLSLSQVQREYTIIRSYYKHKVNSLGLETR